MSVQFDEKTEEGKNDCTVGRMEEKWKGIISTDRRR